MKFILGLMDIKSPTGEHHHKRGFMLGQWVRKRMGKPIK